MQLLLSIIYAERLEWYSNMRYQPEGLFLQTVQYTITPDFLKNSLELSAHEKLVTVKFRLSRLNFL